MVVRKGDSNKGRLGKKIARTLAATVVVVPGILANPMVIDQHRSFATEPATLLPFPETMYVGQRLELNRYGLEYDSNDYFQTSSGGLYYDSGSFELIAEQAGTYTVYIYEYVPEDEDYNESAVDITVKYPDIDEDGTVDIADLVKYISTESEIVGDSTPFSSYMISSMLYWVNLSEGEVNHAPTLRSDVSFEMVLPSSQNSLSLGCSCFFTDQDGDNLTYMIEANSNPEAVDVRIIDGQLWVKPGTTPGLSYVTVRAYDGRGGFADAIFTIQPNRAPELGSASTSISVFRGSTTVVHLNDYFIDPDGHILTYALVTPVNLEMNTVFLGGNGNSELTIMAGGGSSLNIGTLQVEVTDELGLSMMSNATFTITFETVVVSLD